MSDSKYKTMRHIETVRNYLDACSEELNERGQLHDQTKLDNPELETFDKYTPMLKTLVYDSEEYRACLKAMAPALKHHYMYNDHHPEHFENGIKDMNLIQLLEMIVDWKASGMRHYTGDIFKSIELNSVRFGISDELKQILINTAEWLEIQNVYHRADES